VYRMTEEVDVHRLVLVAHGKVMNNEIRSHRQSSSSKSGGQNELPILKSKSFDQHGHSDHIQVKREEKSLHSNDIKKKKGDNSEAHQRSRSKRFVTLSSYNNFLGFNNESMDDVKEQDVAVVATLQRGSCLAKVTTRGALHFRLFLLSSDRKTLVWFSPKKNEAKTFLIVNLITDIVEGQSLFPRKLPCVENLSFTIVNQNKQKLHVIAKDAQEFTIWTQGLRLLAKGGDAVDDICVNVPLPSETRSKLLLNEKQSPRASSTKKLQSELESVRKDFRKLSGRAGSVVYPYVNPRMEIVKKMLRKVRPQIMEDLSMEELDYWTWRLKLEITCLAHMMK